MQYDTIIIDEAAMNVASTSTSCSAIYGSCCRVFGPENYHYFGNHRPGTVSRATLTTRRLSKRIRANLPGGGALSANRWKMPTTPSNAIELQAIFDTVG